jgi:hypothetical protein
MMVGWARELEGAVATAVLEQAQEEATESKRSKLISTWQYVC